MVISTSRFPSQLVREWGMHTFFHIEREETLHSETPHHLDMCSVELLITYVHCPTSTL